MVDSKEHGKLMQRIPVDGTSEFIAQSTSVGLIVMGFLCVILQL